MSIIQINLWKCEICGKTSMTCDEEVSMYDDPVVEPPKEGWAYIGEGKGEKLTCPECRASEVKGE